MPNAKTDPSYIHVKIEPRPELGPDADLRELTQMLTSIVRNVLGDAAQVSVRTSMSPTYHNAVQLGGGQRRIMVTYNDHAVRRATHVLIPAHATNIRCAAELELEHRRPECDNYVQVRLDGTSQVYTFRCPDEVEEGDRVVFQVFSSRGPQAGTVIGLGRGSYTGPTKIARLAA